MAINNFKPFATAANANVMSQADWEALPALLSGFISGPAKSAQVNKAIRQASFIAAALAQYTANKSGLDVLDDGDVAGFIAKMSTAFGKDFQALDATLTALAGLATGANKLPYFTGADTVAQTDLTQIGRDVIGQTTVANLLSYLGALATSGGTITGNFHVDGETSSGGNISTSASVLAAYRLAVGADVLDPAAYIDDQGNLHSYKWHNQNLFDDVSRRIIGESALQAGFSGADISKPYLMHSNGQSVFLVTSTLAGIGIPMIGMPFYWPIDKMPNLIFPELSGMSFAKMNGASFNASLFPNLAKVFPSLVLPDTRGEFIRVWDDGRGIDSQRDMLSTQADSLKSHGHRFIGTNGTAGGSSVLAIQNNASDILTYGINQPDSSTKIAIEATGGNETRPRNIAFSFIVRTA